MKTTTIRQFTLANAVEISGMHFEHIGPLVSIIQNQGSMHFMFSMTPDQAREMAAALFYHANALEQAA